jgi:hypothetical protein
MAPSSDPILCTGKKEKDRAPVSFFTGRNFESEN